MCCGNEILINRAKKYRREAAILKDNPDLPKILRTDFKKQFRAYDFVVKYYESLDDSFPKSSKEDWAAIDAAFYITNFERTRDLEIEVLRLQND
jgi:hypothetical protein